MQPKFQIGERVKLGTSMLEIVQIDKFGATPHYGVWINSQVQNDPNQFQTGWIPVSLLDMVGNQ